MSATESQRPPDELPPRRPRHHDSVFAARHNAPDCVNGIVLKFLGETVSVRTQTKRGTVHMDASRFTWSIKRHGWVCWPQDVVRTIKRLEQDDALLPRPSEYAPIGSFILVDGRAGWVTRLLGKPVEFAGGVGQMDAIRAYVVSTRDGEFSMELPEVRFDGTRRIWIGRRARRSGAEC